jgi:hypothetical protein
MNSSPIVFEPSRNRLDLEAGDSQLAATTGYVT